MNNRVVVIGGGVSGMSAAGALSELGVEVVLLEKQTNTGGHLKNWDRLFPSRRPGNEVLAHLNEHLNGVEIRCSNQVKSIFFNDAIFTVIPDNSDPVTANSIVVATGYELFDAKKKEEYGYGIYDNVITSAELEFIFKKGEPLTTRQGKTPARVAFIHCVGSRDEKVGNLYCSKVCCVTGVKQAIEVREMLPGCEVFSFYMDLRMYDRHFEELYCEAQQKWNISFIRGRLSECAENPDFSLVLKTEDTLTGRPMKITVDMIILLTGFVPNPSTAGIAIMLGLKPGADGFLTSADEHVMDNSTNIPGVFITGAVKGPATIVNSVADARATAMQVRAYLNGEMVK